MPNLDPVNAALKNKQTGDDDMHKIKQGGGLALLLAIALFSPITTYAQTTVTTRESNFELVAVDGNVLVVRDQNGTRELTVPPDFRFTVDGKSLAVGDLKAGMKGNAVITTTTTQRPVYVTTIKKGTVTNQTARSIQIKEDNGKVHRFTQSEIDTRGIRLYMGDTPIRISQLNPGDKISATIITEGKPEILTAQAVDAQLAATPPPAPAPAAAPTPAPEPTEETAVESPAAAPAAEPQALEPEPAPVVAETEAASVEPAPLPKPYTKNPFFWLVVAIVILALIWVLIRRRVKKDEPK
jgi:hypothetical protein